MKKRLIVNGILLAGIATVGAAAHIYSLWRKKTAVQPISAAQPINAANPQPETESVVLNDNSESGESYICRYFKRINNVPEDSEYPGKEFFAARYYDYLREEAQLLQLEPWKFKKELAPTDTNSDAASKTLVFF